MTIPREGDLVVLKSGGPIMTIDAVNTSVFDDNTITGVSCVWFVGDKLQRVRFDHNAIEPARIAEAEPVRQQAGAEESTGEYKESLDVMIAAMNIPADTAKPDPGIEAMSIKPRRDSEKKSARNGAVIEASRKRRDPKAPMN
ncbi:YodC family protein [Bradyrhizobium prioriisuperbiae]|uniref:YodC family protein n=1 Tax=Bradyrhizobium prioriisuperbiae TaxID=2854389 RepID=UPI0028E86998|nr:DUF2158 domain-containing protein [Bradyrhizobium prioritasuperba]